MIKKTSLVFFILISLVIAYNLLKQITETLDSSKRLSRVVEEIAELEGRNKELKKKLEEIKSEEFVEEQARNKLGLVKSGETLVIISDIKIKQTLESSTSAQENRLPNWLGWWKVFFK